MSLTIILISGKARVGKDTVADFICERINDYNKKHFFNKEKYINVSKKNFAKKLKDIAKQVFGWDGQKDEKGRNLLINLGCAARDYNINFWVDETVHEIEMEMSWIKNRYLYVISDWRFINEYERMNQILSEKFKDNNILNILKVRIEGPQRLQENEYNNNTSISEVELDKYNFDYTFYNVEDFQQLYEKVDYHILSKFI